MFNPVRRIYLYMDTYTLPVNFPVLDSRPASRPVWEEGDSDQRRSGSQDANHIHTQQYGFGVIRDTTTQHHQVGIEGPPVAAIFCRVFVVVSRYGCSVECQV